MGKPAVLQLVTLCLVCFALAPQGSNGFGISPSPETSSVIPPVQEKLGPVSHEKSFENNAPSSASQPTGSFPHLEPALRPLPSAPAPSTTKGLVPSLPPSDTTVLPPANTAPPPLPLQGHAPSTPAPNTTKGLVPSLPPSVTTVLPPSNTAPPPLPRQGHAPSTPAPNTTKGFVPSLPPSVTTVLPPSNIAPPPQPLQGHAPSTPAPNTTKGLVPSLPPSVTTVLPPSNTAPPPLPLQSHTLSTPAPTTTKGLVPSLPPSVTTVSPPSNTAPPPLALQGHAPSTPIPNTTKGLVPSSPPNITTVLPPSNTAPPPLALQVHVPIMQPTAPQEKPPVTESPISVPFAPGKAPVVKAPISVPVAPAPTAPRGKAPVTGVPILTPVAPVPVATPSRSKSLVSPAVNPSTPETSPSSAHQGNSSANKGPISEPITPVPVASPSQGPQNLTSIHPATPQGSPSTTPDHEVSPTSSPPPSIGSKKDEPVAAPSYVKPLPSPPPRHAPTKAPANNKPERNSHVAPSPSILSPKSPSNRGYHPPASSPSTSYFNHHTRNKSTSPPPASSPSTSYFNHHTRNKSTSPPAASSYISPSASEQEGPVTPPASLPRSRQIQYAPPPHTPGFSISPSHNPLSPPLSYVSPAPSPSSENTQTFNAHSPKGPTVLLQPPLQAFPPPPPNEDCSAIICTEPYTNTPPGSPCGCVQPIQVGLRLSVALYTFFPLVAELAQEVAVGVFIKQSQVRIIGANAATQQPEKTVVLIDLVPLGEKFDNTTAYLIFQRFWQKQVAIQASFFGGYEVLYVRYPGLPPSPPSADGSTIDDGPYAGTDSNARTIKPLGVNVHKGQHKNRITGGIVAIIVLSALVALVLCSAAAWVFLFKNRQVTEPGPAPLVAMPSLTKQTGAPGSVIGSRDSFASLSFGSSIATCTGSAKTFSASDIERATAHFDDSRILGEGGFGRVYRGLLEDGNNIAVKVLKRDDQQGGREFLAEVEMLSRLHHRNLVKLIGICIEEGARCLVYELIPNGSVESHLHGVDKETAPLNWGARMKIALGAARGLAYLHEDSSPRVIHRDFKSSNILLEDDFTPKVSDFGLARTALDEENQHISTRVMGTFGYVAPEYAMTGHLLVKSDVYSYGVVLLELLSGRKPVDMSQPPGQENLVAWARPLLTSREGLETIIDHSLSDISFDSMSKVAAIASMCVQPEVSNRPFMGEVVQALKLVCDEIDEARELGSRTSSLEDLSIDLGAATTTPSRQVPVPLQSQYSVASYESEFDIERGMSVSELFSSSVRLGRQQSESFRRHSSSGPLGSRSKNFWEKVRRLSGGSVSERGSTIRLWPGSH